jgi:MATE family multidrug resistance protein
MMTNAATALFGMADLWIIGQLGEPTAQAGVELGAKLIMGLLVVFNFLRTGTIALTAQAAGRADIETQTATLVRALGIACMIGLALLVLKPVAVPLGLDLLHARGEVANKAAIYTGIRYWGSLPWLVNAALVGWLIGLRRVREVLAVEIISNLIHVALDTGFVLGLGWGVTGIAFATLSSEMVKLAALTMIAARQPAAIRAVVLVRQSPTWSRKALGELFRLNRDLFLRTLLLTAAILLMVRDGAYEGPLVLAANGILYQLFFLSALLLDGFESAAQVLCGEAVGARDRACFDRYVRALLLWGLGSGATLTIVYALAGSNLATSFSTNPAIIATISIYISWVILLPVIGVTSFVYDGIFIGATWTRAMLITMAIAFSVYGALLLVTGSLGNHGLWLAFSLFFIVRAAGQAFMLPRLSRSTFGA